MFISNFIFKNDIFNIVDTISGFSLLLNFFSCSIGDTWITHRMSMISVSHCFNKNWSLIKTMFLGKFECLSNLKDIISINLIIFI